MVMVEDNDERRTQIVDGTEGDIILSGEFDNVEVTYTAIDWGATSDEADLLDGEVAELNTLLTEIVEYGLSLFRARMTHSEVGLDYKNSQRIVEGVFRWLADPPLETS